MASTHAVLGPKPEFFNEDNKIFIQRKVAEVLRNEFKQNIIFDPLSIVQVMQRTYEDRVESVPRMNQRVIMDLCRSFRNEQINNNKHLMWAESYASSQMVFDPLGNKGPDLQNIKLSNRLGRDRVGSTRTFVFF
jgi:hypothetical protein